MKANQAVVRAPTVMLVRGDTATRTQTKRPPNARLEAVEWGSRYCEKVIKNC